MYATGQTAERVVAERGLTREDMEALDPQDPFLYTLGNTWPYNPE
jgi:hypothetical protein